MHYGKKNESPWIGNIIQWLRDLLEIAESDVDCISHIEYDANTEIFSKHNTDTEKDYELDDSKNDDDSDGFIGKDGKMIKKKKDSM